MSAQAIAISQIDASGRLRPVDPERAEAYAASIDAEGLAQPIVVRPMPDGDGYILVDGAHRLAAMRLLGRTDLSVGAHVVVADIDDEAAEGRELVANLFCGMTALDRAIFLHEAKQRYDKNRKKIRQSKRKDQQIQFDKVVPETGIILSERFSKNAAKRIGLSDTQIREAVSIAKNLDFEAILQLRGTMIEDNQNELKLLAKMEIKDQRKAVSVIRAKEAKTVTEARVVIGLDKRKTDDTETREEINLSEAWLKAREKVRARWMERVGLAYVEGTKA